MTLILLSVSVYESSSVHGLRFKVVHMKSIQYDLNDNAKQNRQVLIRIIGFKTSDFKLLFYNNIEIVINENVMNLFTVTFGDLFTL